MSVQESMLRQQLADQERKVRTFVSTIINALERITIFIDEDDPDEAKREIAELQEQLGGLS